MEANKLVTRIESKAVQNSTSIVWPVANRHEILPVDFRGGIFWTGF